MEIFNNRELASVTLLVALFVWSANKNKDVWSSLRTLLRAFYKKQILIILSALILYTFILVFFLSEIDVWNMGQLKNTIIWFVFAGVVQVMGTTKVNDPKLYLKTSLNAQVKLVVLVQFLVAFHSFGYFVELILVSVVFVLTMCNTIALNNPEHQKVKKLFDFILSAIGIALLIGSFWNIYINPNKFFSIDTFRDFLTPMLLSVGLLPFIYGFYYFLAFERAFTLSRIYTDSRSLQRYAKMQSLIAFRGSHGLIHKWMQYSCTPEFESKESIKQSILAFKKSITKTV